MTQASPDRELVQARELVLRACARTVRGESGPEDLVGTLHDLSAPTRRVVTRSVSTELLTSLHLSAGRRPADDGARDLLGMISVSLHECPRTPNAGAFGHLSDLATAALLRAILPGGGPTAMTAQELALVLAVPSEDRAQAACSLALPGVWPRSVGLGLTAADVGQAACLALLERRYLRAARALRCLRLLPLDEQLTPFLYEAVDRVRGFADRYAEIEYHVALITSIRAGFGTEPDEVPRAEVSRDAATRAWRGDVVLDRTLTWVLENIDRFALPPPGDDAATMRRLKPVGELALVASLLLRRGSPSPLPDLVATGHRLLCHCWQALGCGERLAEFLERHPSMLIYATIYPPFARWGYKSARLEDAVRSATAVRGFVRLDYPPWRALDLVCALTELHLPSPWTADDIYARTWLAQLPEPWSLSEESAYALTHTVFYMTDFGDHPRRLPPTHREYLRMWVPAWQRYFERIGNLDLLAEMTMVLRCLGLQCDGTDVAAALVSAQRQQGDGAVPGPVDAGWDLLDPGMSSDADRAFLRNYHTSLVAVLACAFTTAWCGPKERPGSAGLSSLPAGPRTRPCSTPATGSGR